MGYEQLGSGKKIGHWGIQTPKASKLGVKWQKLCGIQFVTWNPSVTLTHQPLQSSVDCVQGGNEKFGSMDPLGSLGTTV